MSRKSKRQSSEKVKIKHVNSEVDTNRYDSFETDKNNNLIKINKKRTEINRSISLTSSYDKRNIINNALPPSKSLDNQLTATHKKPITFPFKNLKFKSKLSQQIQPTSATSLSSANQSPKLSSIKASSFDTTILSSPKLRTNLSLNNVKSIANFFTFRPRSVSDCSNCIQKSNLHLAHKAQHNFIKVIKHDREFIKSFQKFDENNLIDKVNKSKEEQSTCSTESTKNCSKTEQIIQNSESNNDLSNRSINKIDSEKLNSNQIDQIKDKRSKGKKLNIDDVVNKFREKHKQYFQNRTLINKFKLPAICIDENYLVSWVPPGLNREEVSFY